MTTAASIRKKRLRARQRNGEIVVPVVVNNATIEKLIGMQWLMEVESEDRAQIGAAIADLLADMKFSGTRGQSTILDRGLIVPRSNYESER
ncbi:hypothetical protein QA649_19670 [Bradyrhizobium sp. CB1717]|uniref:hypothetical protein n=1 Tax=Bradyrhizobium sp. CB1717 TaxID=3039154 RepID=UPI0024B074F2|nr:hypothetical protein [Bradyrhizobium sp. CB1717]WFU28350.1 hypothetical protein QA649_19670 [Bradyrhizobium sp. CB1717]